MVDGVVVEKEVRTHEKEFELLLIFPRLLLQAARVAFEKEVRSGGKAALVEHTKV